MILNSTENTHAFLYITVLVIGSPKELNLFILESGT